MLSALQQGVKGNIALNANAAIIAGRGACEALGDPRRATQKVLQRNVSSHVYASFRVLTLYARDAGHEVIQ